MAIHDYFGALQAKLGGSEVMSRNAASCAAVLLASRHDDVYETFGFAILVAQLFHLPPSKSHHRVQSARTSGLIAIGGLMSLSMGYYILVLYEMALVMICVVVPAGFEYMKRIKNADKGKEANILIQRHRSITPQLFSSRK